MFCNLHFPKGMISEFRIEWHFRIENLYIPVCWQDEKNLLILSRSGRELTTSRTPMLYNKQGVPHPTCSVIIHAGTITICDSKSKPPPPPPEHL